MDEDKAGTAPAEQATAGEKPSVAGPASRMGGDAWRGDGDGQARGDIRRQAGETVEQARGMVGQLFGDVRHAAEEMLEERKERAAEGVHGFAEALRRTAGNLRGENETVARYAERAAETVDRFSESVRGRRFGEMIAELDDFARRQPTLFLIGAVAAGFIAGRFMAGSAEREPERWRHGRGVGSERGRFETETVRYGDFGARRSEPRTAGYGNDPAGPRTGFGELGTKGTA